MFFFKFILDDGSIEEALEAVQQLKSSVDGVAIVESLGDDRGQSSFELLDLGSKLVEVVIEFFFVNVHDVVFDALESLNCGFEFVENLFDTFSKCFSLSSSQLYFVQFVELNDGLGQVQYVMGSF